MRTTTTPPLIGGLFTRDQLWLVAVQGLALIALFHRFFLKQHDFSMEKPQDWGHAYVIPLISGFLVWKQRREIVAVSKHAYWPGLIPFLFGIMAYFFFVVGVPNHMLQGTSIIITIFGLVLLNVGPAAMKFLFLPIIYLACGMTISEKVMILITFPLQLIASRGGYILLNVIGFLFGFHAEVSGNTIEVISKRGVSKLNIADACSGLRMLIAFLALACAVALISCKHWWQRIALILMAPVVALFMNVIRVTILGIGSMYDPDIATGDVHMLIGTILLVPSLLLFMGVVWVLNRVSEDSDPPGGSQSGNKTGNKSGSKPGNKKINSKAGGAGPAAHSTAAGSGSGAASAQGPSDPHGGGQKGVTA